MKQRFQTAGLFVLLAVALAGCAIVKVPVKAVSTGVSATTSVIDAATEEE